MRNPEESSISSEIRIKEFKKHKSISVIIPTFRPDSFFEECFNSINDQDLRPDHFEVIIVLNGDRDPYWEFLQRVIRNTKLDVVLLYSERRGVSNARNMGLDIIRGDYVVFIDDDDVVSPTYLKSLCKKSRENQIACAKMVDFKTSTDHFTVGYLGRAFERYESNNPFSNRSFFSTVTAKTIPANGINECRFQNNVNLGEDALFMTKISRSIHSVTLADEDCIYFRRINDKSSSRKRNRVAYELNNFMILNWEYLKLLIEVALSKHLLFVFMRYLAIWKNARARFSIYWGG